MPRRPSPPPDQPWAEPLPKGADPRTHRFRFAAELHPPSGAMIWNRVLFPWSVTELFGTKGRVRVTGTVAGRPFDRSLNPSREGHFLLISRDDMRALGLAIGDVVTVELQVDTRPLQFTEPDEITAALALEPGLRAAFEALSTSKRRTLCHWVASAKRADTRAQRAAQLLRVNKINHSKTDNE